MIADEVIIKKIKENKKILIITCPGCACESLSYDKQLPNRSLTEDKGFENIAIAVHKERDRIAALCNTMGIGVDSITVAFPCELVETECARIEQKVKSVDAVCVLACTGGYIGIHDILPDYQGKIIPLMKTLGTFVFHLKVDESGENSIVEKSNARILYFSSKQISIDGPEKNEFF
jgi:hypothetical protein